MDDVKWGNVFLVFMVVLLFVIGVKYTIFNEPKDTTEEGIKIETYNGVSFVKVVDVWIFDYTKDDIIYSIPLKHKPTDLLLIDNPLEYDFESKDKYYISVDEDLGAESVLAGVEIAKVFGKATYGVLKKEVKSSVPYNLSGVPQVTCENATDSTGVLFMTFGDETKLEQDGNCIILQAVNDSDMMKIANKLIFVALDID